MSGPSPQSCKKCLFGAKCPIFLGQTVSREDRHLPAQEGSQLFKILGYLWLLSRTAYCRKTQKAWSGSECAGSSPPPPPQDSPSLSFG